MQRSHVPLDTPSMRPYTGLFEVARTEWAEGLLSQLLGETKNHLLHQERRPLGCVNGRSAVWTVQAVVKEMWTGVGLGQACMDSRAYMVLETL